MDTIQVGSIGQAYAEKFLKRKGYKLVVRNWRSRLGEIDLIVQDEDILIFVEVKSVVKQSDYFGPEDNLTPAKERKLKQLALAYLNYKHMGEVSYRIDLVAIDLDENLQMRDARHYQSVVEE